MKKTLKTLTAAAAFALLAPGTARADSSTQNLITGSTVRAGQPQADEAGDTNHVYELPTAHAEYADVDGMTATRKLWLRARTPSMTSTDQQAAFTVTVTTGVGL